MLEMAREINAELNDPEYVHIFVHFYEMVNTLHQVNVHHRDLKNDALTDFEVTKASVLFDFSMSTVYTDLPCLDVYLRKPRTFERVRAGEIELVKKLVIRYSTSSKFS